MNPKLLLIAALCSLYAAPSLATIPLIFASQGAANTGTSGIYFGSASNLAAGTTTTTIAGGAVLLGALGLTIGKALLLRRLTGRTGRRFGRSAEAPPMITDAQAAQFITELLQEYEQAYA